MNFERNERSEAPVKDGGGRMRCPSPATGASTDDHRLRQGSPPAACPPDESPRGTDAPTAQPYIAVVDDNPSVCRALERLFHSAGLAAHGFSSAAEFLTATADAPPACAVVDVHMPGINGLELQEQVRRSDRPVPLIFLTASDREAERCQALERGARAYFRKPVDDADLLAAVEQLLTEKVAAWRSRERSAQPAETVSFETPRTFRSTPSSASRRTGRIS